MASQCQVRPGLVRRLITSSLLLISLGQVTSALYASEEVMSDDGREVLLRDDGTWEFRSTDRFANTADDRRVRLKEDHTWEYVGNAPLTTQQQVRTTTTDISLQRAVIEVHEEKINKNTRVQTQTVFYLAVAISPLVEQGIAIDRAQIPLIHIRDDKGNEYPVLTLTPDQGSLEPNSKQTITIRTDGSPSWWSGSKTMTLELAAGIFGLDETISLTQAVRDMDRKEVEGF